MHCAPSTRSATTSFASIGCVVASVLLRAATANAQPVATATPTATPLPEGTPTPAAAVCGNGVQEPGEECDDGNVAPEDGCSATCTLEPCVAAPVSGCIEAAQAQLRVHEKMRGHEKIKLLWKQLTDATTQTAFGNPVDGTTQVALCLYDDGGRLVRSLVVDRAAQQCGTRWCWAAKALLGYVYKDVTASANGVKKLLFVAGDAGHGKATALGANNAAKAQLALPSGTVAALRGNVAPTMQLVTDAGFCVTATLTDVMHADGAHYEAQK